MDQEKLDGILKGGMLKAHKKKVMVAVAVVGAVAAYLVGDVDLISLIKNVMLSTGGAALIGQ